MKGAARLWFGVRQKGQNLDCAANDDEPASIRFSRPIYPNRQGDDLGDGLAQCHFELACEREIRADRVIFE